MVNRIKVFQKDLEERLAADTKQPIGNVHSILESFKKLTAELVKEDHIVVLTSFGEFIPRIRHARGGINPQNPTERIRMPEVKVCKFKVGKGLKQTVKG